MLSKHENDKRMSDDELENVAGGQGVMLISYLQDGKVRVDKGDFHGNIDDLEKLFKGGGVKSINFGGNLGSITIKDSDLPKIKQRYEDMGYKIIDPRAK